MNYSKEELLKLEKFDLSLEKEYYDLAKKYKVLTEFKRIYERYKKQALKYGNTIYFGEDAPIKEMVSGEYHLGENGELLNYRGNKVCYQLVQPVEIYQNIINGLEFVKCAFKHYDRWKYFVVNRETLSHNGKIVSLANKGLDVTSNNSSLLVKYLSDMLHLNSDKIPIKKSVSKLGWIDDFNFIPYNEEITYDGDDNFRNAFEAIKSKGSYERWLKEMHYVRENLVARLTMAASFGSVLLKILGKKPLVVMIWGTTGDGKTVAGMVAMSIWGNPTEGCLQYSLNNTDNFNYRIADFFNNLPVFFDELQTYKGNTSKLIMNLTEGIDRGKAKVDGGIEVSKKWQNIFILTGEQTASNYNSDGGALNRLIEINSNGKIIKFGSQTANCVKKNYGFAGKEYIEYLQTIPEERIEQIYNERLKSLLEIKDTEEKQAQNMAILLTADDLALECIFKDETKIEAEDVKEYMFSKEEIDVSERAYDVIIDECEINKNKFGFVSSVNNMNSSSYTEFWGLMNEYEITIIKQALDNLLAKNGYSSKKILKDWANKGYIEVYSDGRKDKHTSILGRKARYVTIKLKKE